MFIPIINAFWMSKWFKIVMVRWNFPLWSRNRTTVLEKLASVPSVCLSSLRALLTHWVPKCVGSLPTSSNAPWRQLGILQIRSPLTVSCQMPQAKHGRPRDRSPRTQAPAASRSPATHPLCPIWRQIRGSHELLGFHYLLEPLTASRTSAYQVYQRLNSYDTVYRWAAGEGMPGAHSGRVPGAGACVPELGRVTLLGGGRAPWPGSSRSPLL